MPPFGKGRPDERSGWWNREQRRVKSRAPRRGRLRQVANCLPQEDGINTRRRAAGGGCVGCGQPADDDDHAFAWACDEEK